MLLDRVEQMDNVAKVDDGSVMMMMVVSLIMISFIGKKTIGRDKNEYFSTIFNSYDIVFLLIR